METFEVGDRVIFREDESTVDSTGTVTGIVDLEIDLGENVYTVTLDEEREDSVLWTVAQHELTKSA